MCSRPAHIIAGSFADVYAELTAAVSQLPATSPIIRASTPLPPRCHLVARVHHKMVCFFTCLTSQPPEPALFFISPHIRLEGGESTAMALIGERWGVFPRLKQWVSEGRPVWGTCAGMILLSDHALMQKEGGQSLVGGLNVEVSEPALRDVDASVGITSEQ